MKKTTLVIMAAGMGSRFGGGIKQLARVDDSGHIIMDYSIHDAIEAGFNKIIFIIRREIEADFREIIGRRIEEICLKNGVETAYCFQALEDVSISVPAGRTKPWGTGKAILAAKEAIDSAFAVINADDYYGKQAFRVMHDWLTLDHGDSEISMVGFKLFNTLSENGSVTRGVCTVEGEEEKVIDVVETHNIFKTPDGPVADSLRLDPNSYVSMNMWGFPAEGNQAPAFMAVLDEAFESFLIREVPANPLKAEFLVPVLIGQLLREGSHTIHMLPSGDRWFGVTYIEDTEIVRDSFAHLISEGVYSKDLFSDLG